MPGRGNSSVEAVGRRSAVYGSGRRQAGGAELSGSREPGAEAGAAGVGSHTASGTVKEAADGGGMQEMHLERLLVANGL